MTTLEELREAACVATSKAVTERAEELARERAEGDKG